VTRGHLARAESDDRPFADQGAKLVPDSRANETNEVSAIYPNVRKIAPSDLREALSRGIADFQAMPSHLFFLALIYPIVSIGLAVGLSPALFFPLLTGFALIGPFAALGLYEISRRRELGLVDTSREYGVDPSWKDAFGVLRSHSIFSILSLGLLLLVIFGSWVMAAQTLYYALLGPAAPDSYSEFINSVIHRPEGPKFILYGTVIGFFFAVAAFSVSVVSFPLLLDRDVEVPVAIFTSLKAVLKNPFTMALWGLIVALCLLTGTLLLFAGLAVVIPVLGHATWHLYRKTVEPPAG
jgi:uncharacterized membrane protein